MRKMMYFAVKAKKGFEGKLEDVPCRFHEGRVYEIDERNAKLCAAIRAKIAAGDFVELDRSEGMDRLEAQEIADRARKHERIAAQAVAKGVSVEALTAAASATVTAGAAPAEKE